MKTSRSSLRRQDPLALGWTAPDLFGLAEVSDRPGSNCCRLRDGSEDCVGTAHAATDIYAFPIEPAPPEMQTCRG